VSSAARESSAVQTKERPATGLRHSVRALRHRNYALFWVGALVSNSGTWIQNATVPYVLYKITGSNLWVGLSTFAQFLPSVAFGPIGGSMADRFDRRRVLLVTQTLLAIAAVGMWVSWIGGVRSPGLILALVAVSGVLNGLNVPSWQAFVPALVPREDLLSAITLNSLQFNAARAVGSALAGLVLYRFGAGAAFMANALSFGCVLLALAAVQLPRQIAHVATERGVTRQFAAALRYVQARPGIFVGIITSILIAFLGNPINQFAVVFATDVYHVDKLAYGLLASAMGIGALLSAPLVSGWDAVLRRADVVRYGLPAYGLACAMFGFSTHFSIGFIGLILAGAGFLAVISATNTAVQVIVADRMRGRVMAARVMSFTLAYAFGGLVQGWLADAIGPRVTVTGAGLLLAAGGLALASRPSLLAHLDDPADESG
jgi:MFS family permease